MYFGNEIMVSDDEFDQIIEFDAECDAEKENVYETVTPRKKTKKEQYNLISEFVERHDERALGKEKFGDLWNGLTDSLNSLGPPCRTSSNWRKVWNEYKYNHDGRRPVTKTDVRSNLCGSSTNQTDQASKSTDPIIILNDRLDDVAKKLFTLTKQQSETKKLVETMLPQILKEQRETNELLKKLCRNNVI